MSLIIYLDEAGDHSLQADDKDFPIFALVMIVCDFADYAKKIVPQVFQLKMDYWGHESILLHSRDIRKCKGDFSFLMNGDARPGFYDRLNTIMGDSPYQIVPDVIKKNDHKATCEGDPENPYDLALRMALEGVISLVESENQKDILMIAEARGRREDRDLAESFAKVIAQGTEIVSATRFENTNFKLKFVEKKMNVIGTQLADLAAYPIARAVLNPSQPNPAYEVVKQKFYTGNGWSDGIKIFPC